jgi:hypothetical protein
MNAKQYQLHSLSILVIVERISNDTNGNPRFDISILSLHNQSKISHFCQWSPLGTTGKLRKLKNGKYRMTDYGTMDEICDHVFQLLTEWFDRKVAE